MLLYLPQMLWVSTRSLLFKERSRPVHSNKYVAKKGWNTAWWTWTLNMADIRNQWFQHQMTGKITLENLMSIKSFSNHVLNGNGNSLALVNWQYIENFLRKYSSLVSFFAKLGKAVKFFLLCSPQWNPGACKILEFRLL